jgi:hypothetical protein
MKVQRQLVVTTPPFRRLKKRENDDSSVGYIRITQSSAVSKKDLVNGLLLDLIFCRFSPSAFWM